MTSPGAVDRRVALTRQTTYDLPALREGLTRLLAPLGGMEAFVSRGARVVLKPNLLLGFAPERAATTHPAILRVVAERVLDCGGVVKVGDSPGAGSCRKVAEQAGLAAVARDLGIELIEFTPREVHDPSRQFPDLVLGAELLDADVVINLPKLKTHCQMLMTLSVKNMFGAVVGLRKTMWHLHAGRDKPTFARMIHEIYRAVSPALQIVDGVVGMDGDGPTGGIPNQVGLLAAGADGPCVDAVLMDVVGLARERLWTLGAAVACGETAWRAAEAVGEEPAALKPARWILPRTTGLHSFAPGLTRKIPLIGEFLHSQFTALPHPEEACVLCRECVRICPAKALSVREEPKRIELDRGKCIACYCCHEMCPHRLMDLRKGLLGRALDTLTGAARPHGHRPEPDSQPLEPDRPDRPERPAE